jgi:myosin heavy chain 9/10/11/14
VSLNPVNNHGARHQRVDSKSGTPHSSTFAPTFIKSVDTARSNEAVKGIEGENDFSGKRYVWLKDPQTAFQKGWIVEELGDGRILVQCEDGSVSTLTSCCNYIPVLSSPADHDE